jgi:predicted MPP superfamily phosphohydrolase
VRATWCTDVHLNFLRPHVLHAFYDAVKAEQPDVVLLTGDMGESGSVARFVEEIAEAARCPVYFVLGNHDYYRSGIRRVREQVQGAARRAVWLPGAEPVRLNERVVLIGVDGWGDARCGDLESEVMLSDWQLIEDFHQARTRELLIETLQRLGANEAHTLSAMLARAPPAEQLLVLTHVPPFPEACWYDGKMSDPEWLPWFTCVATGEVLRRYAREHPGTRITVLCGHTHGQGVFEAAPNLEVRTGGWAPGIEGYGHPIVQATLVLD